MPTGDVQRFERLVLPHLDAVHNYARWLAGNDDAARDLAQEACMRAWRFLDGLRGDSAKPWLLRIVRNCHADRLRGDAARELVSATTDAELEQMHAAQDDASVTADPEQLLLRSATRDTVSRALAGLPVPFREAVVLRDIEDLSYLEIARVLGVPMGTVMSRLARGRKALLAILLEQGAHP